MSTKIPRCEDGTICDREFAPTKHGNVCIRDGHAAECHEDKVAVIDQRPYVFQPPDNPKTFRVCFWKRDDKTAATCREKFDNFGQYAFGDEPHVPSEETSDVGGHLDVHRLGCNIFRTSICNCIGTTEHALNLGESPEPSRPIVYGRPPYETRDFPHMGYLGATLEAWCSRQADWRNRGEPR